MNSEYIINKKASITIEGVTLLSAQQVVDAMTFANSALEELNNSTQKFQINIFETLGMRNLSGMIGEYFAKSVMIQSNGALATNLHQDGYPDLLLTDTPEKKKYFKTLYTEKNGKKYPIDKDHFSPYKYGGIEVKATCGSTPPASKNKKVVKLSIGEQRVSHITSFDWKAHHRNTNNLLSVLWDFIGGLPTYVAAFYSNKLTINDWGKIVKPKDHGGRTTSVSIMNATGIKKMCEEWVAVIDDSQYTQLLSKNKWIGFDVRENVCQ